MNAREGRRLILDDCFRPISTNLSLRVRHGASKHSKQWFFIPQFSVFCSLNIHIRMLRSQKNLEIQNYILMIKLEEVQIMSVSDNALKTAVVVVAECLRLCVVDITGKPGL